MIEENLTRFDKEDVSPKYLNDMLINVVQLYLILKQKTNSFELTEQE